MVDPSHIPERDARPCVISHWNRNFTEGGPIMADANRSSSQEMSTGAPAERAPEGMTSLLIIGAFVVLGLVAFFSIASIG
jgi:hypothetical protein